MSLSIMGRGCRTEKGISGNLGQKERYGLLIRRKLERIFCILRSRAFHVNNFLFRSPLYLVIQKFLYCIWKDDPRRFLGR